jgi:hypothetical protein
MSAARLTDEQDGRTPRAAFPVRRERARDVARAALGAVDEDVHEPALRRGLGIVLAEQPDLVADARAAQVRDPQPGPHEVGERHRRLERAVRLHAQPDHLAGVDVEPALGDQPAVDHGVEVRVVLDVVDVPVDVVVLPARRDVEDVRVVG